MAENPVGVSSHLGKIPGERLRHFLEFILHASEQNHGTTCARYTIRCPHHS